MMELLSWHLLCATSCTSCVRLAGPTPGVAHSDFGNAELDELLIGERKRGGEQHLCGFAFRANKLVIEVWNCSLHPCDDLGTSGKENGAKTKAFPFRIRDHAIADGSGEGARDTLHDEPDRVRSRRVHRSILQADEQSWCDLDHILT